MKVLQLCKFFPPTAGGIETVVFELAEGLTARGDDVAVLCANIGRETVTENHAAGYRVTRVASWGRLLATSMAPALLGELQRAQRDRDIVHVHMPDPLTALALWRSPPRGKLVVHWHSDVVRQRLALRLYRPLQEWLLRRADAVIATSKAYADSSVALQPWQAKVKIVPIGISEPRASHSSISVDSIRRTYRDRRIVFALGRLTYYKGFDILIDAAAEIQTDCVVLIGGQGESLNRLRAVVIERGLSDRVHLIGHIPEEELTAYYQACEVFCMPSTRRAEAFGVVMLEAMAMGRPVVATDIPGSGVPWVNQDGVTGLNVPVGDALALAAALDQLLMDESLSRRMGAAARHRYERMFTASAMTARCGDMYARLVSEER